MSDGVEKILIVSFLTNVQNGNYTPTVPWVIGTSIFGSFTPTTDTNWNSPQSTFGMSSVNGYLKSLQQQKQHKILISLGGATPYFNLPDALSTSQKASDLATSIAYSLLGCGTSNPLNWNRIVDPTDGTFYFDGIDLDFEDGNSIPQNNVALFLTTLRSAVGSSKLITAAPQPAYVFNAGGYASPYNAYSAYVPYRDNNALISTLSSGIGTNALFCLSNVGLFDYLNFQYYNQTADQYPAPAPNGSNFTNITAQIGWLALNATNISNSIGTTPKLIVGLLGNPSDGTTIYTNGYGVDPLPPASDIAAGLHTYLTAAQTTIQNVCSSITSISQWVGGIMFWSCPVAIAYPGTGYNYANAILTDSNYTFADRVLLYGGQTYANQPTGTPTAGLSNPAWQLLAPSPSPSPPPPPPPSSVPPASNVVISGITVSQFTLTWSVDPSIVHNIVTVGRMSYDMNVGTLVVGGLSQNTSYSGTIVCYNSLNQASVPTSFGPVTTPLGLTTLAMTPFLIRGPRYQTPAADCLDWYINCGAVGTSNNPTQLYGSWYAASSISSGTLTGQGGKVIADPTGNPNQATNTYITNLQTGGVKVCAVIGGALGDILGLMNPYTSPEAGTLTNPYPTDLATSIANIILGVSSAPNTLGWLNTDWSTVAFDGLNLDFENIGVGGNRNATNTYPLPQQPAPVFPADINTPIPNGGGTITYGAYVASLKSFLTSLVGAAPGKIITMAPLSPSIYLSGLTAFTALNNGLNSWAPFAQSTTPPTTANFIVPSSMGADALLAPAQLSLFDDIFVQFYNEEPDEYLGGSNFTNILAQWAFLALYTQKNVTGKKVKINIGLAKGINTDPTNGQGVTAPIPNTSNQYWYPQYQTASPPNPSSTQPPSKPFPNIGPTVDASNLNAALLNANILLQRSGLPGAEYIQIGDWCSGVGFWAGGPATQAAKAIYDFTTNGVPNLPTGGITYCWSDAQYPAPDPQWAGNLPIVVKTGTVHTLNPPSGVSSSSVSSTGFVLNWSSDPNTQSNVVTWGSNSSVVYGNSITVSGLVQSTPYAGTITSFNLGLQSSPTQYSVTTTSGTPASVPTITNIVPANSAAVIAWTYSNVDQTGFDISYNGLHSIAPSNATSTNISGLTANTSYGFQVAATNTAGIGRYSSVSNITTCNVAVPGTPSNLTLLSNTTSNITLSWAYAGTDASLYIVYVNSTQNTVTSNKYATTANLTANTVYTLNVAGSNVGGTGSKSSVLSTATLPLQPTGLTFSQQTVSSFATSWAGAAAYYDVCWNTGIIRNYNLKTVTISGLVSNTPYNVAITPYNACNVSGLFVSGQTQTLPGPAAPTTFPSNIQVYAIQPTAATFSWNYTGAVTSYNVYLNGSSTVYCNDAQSPATLNSLTNNTTYSVSIAAVNSVGVGPFSTQTVRFTTSSGPTVPAPLPPTNLSLIISSTSVVANWSSGLYSTTDYGILNGGPSNVVSHPQLFQGLTPNTQNTIALYSSNDTGRSSNLSTAFITAPSVPSNVTVATSTSTSVTVNWSGDANTYSTYINGNISNVRQPQNSQTLVNLAPSTNYIFSVVGYNPCGLAGQSVQYSISTQPGLPLQPTNVVVNNVDSNALGISWTPVPHISNYQVTVLTPFLGLTPIFVTGPPTTISGLLPNTFYTVNVASVTNAGITNAPSIYTVTVPSKPTNLSASSITGTGFQLSWTGDATQYSVSAGPIRQRVSSSNFTFTGLSPGTTYSTDIVPYNSANVAGEKNTIIVQTSTRLPPNPPVIASIDNTAPTSFTVTWNTDPLVSYYIVYLDGISHIVFNAVTNP